MTAHSDIPPGWRSLLSDKGRYWATRERPFSTAQATAGAARTVDGDDVQQLRAAIQEQERLAEPHQ